MSLPSEFIPANSAGQREIHPLVEALCDVALASHQRLLDTCLRNVDMALVQFPIGAIPAVQLELSERLRAERHALQKRYLREVARRFSPLVVPAGGSADRELQRYTRPPTEALEEQLSLDGLARRLRAAHELRLNLLEQRLRVLVRRTDLPISTSAYAPATVIEALRVTLEALDIDLPLRKVLFGLYEPAAIAALGEIYEKALGVLNRRGGDSFAVEAEDEQKPETALSIDTPTLACLRAELTGARSRSDATLASALLGIVVNLPLEAHQHHPIAQRLALLGRLWAAQFALLTPAGATEMEWLRFTLIKIVLADSSFFASAGHPLRLLLREAGDRQDETARARVAKRIEQVAMSALFVRDLLPALPPLETPLIDSCLDQLRQQDNSREEAKLNQARRDVAQALEKATLLYARPQGLRLFLRAGWGPLLTQRLLRHGEDSAPWRDALLQLEQLLSALIGEHTRVRDFETQLNLISAELFDAGMRSDRCERLIQALREAYYELRIGVDLPEAQPPAAGNTTLPGVGLLDLPEAPVDPVLARSVKRATSAPSEQPDLELRPMRKPR